MVVSVVVCSVVVVVCSSVELLVVVVVSGFDVVVDSVIFVAFVTDEVFEPAASELLSSPFAKPTSLYPTKIASATTAITLTETQTQTQQTETQQSQTQQGGTDQAQVLANVATALADQNASGIKSYEYRSEDDGAVYLYVFTNDNHAYSVAYFKSSGRSKIVQAW